MLQVIGEGNISAKVVADSVSSVSGKRITTFELEYPRFIHSEFMTHRLFSRNAASSRAIPVEKVIDQVESDPATPIHWGKNQSGMQAKEQLQGEPLENAVMWWEILAGTTGEKARILKDTGVHKQVVNRVLEPYQFIKVVCTATEFDNFFWLRCHEDAQPEIRELAECMYEAYKMSVPESLNPGEWHTPYVSHMNDEWGNLKYYIDVDGETKVLSLAEALRVSSSCCAQISFRVLDESLEKAEKIYKMLVESEPVHASPFEHSATPMRDGAALEDEGVTSLHKELGLMSGNLAGWVQYRQTIENHCKW